MKDEIGLRLRELLSKCNYKSTILSEKMGKSRTVISSYLSGRCYPPFDFLIELKKEIPLLNMDWLVTGDGDMLHSEILKGIEDASLKKKVAELESREKQLTDTIIRMGSMLGTNAVGQGDRSKSKGVFNPGNWAYKRTVINTPWLA